MSEPVHICFDRIIKRDLYRSLTPVRGMGTRAILVKRSMWPNGSNLRVSFLQGTPSQQTMVEQVARQWTQHANLSFDFGDNPQAEIRIGFAANDGAWSAVGTDCLDQESFPRNDRTMNFGWLDEGVILHEFGHAIGLGHEHSNPKGGLRWNELVVIQALKGPPNFWSEEVTRHNVFRKYSFDQIAGTEFDTNSIMLYAFPATWTLNGVATHENQKLSARDVAFISGANAYPRTQRSQDELIVDLPIHSRKVTHAAIGKPGEEDLFRFQVKETGYYQVETRGRSNVFMRLYGPNNRTALIEEDDDSGKSYNAQIVRKLEPGEYLVQIRHSDFARGSGEYGVRVKGL